jgi:hypothetical protein
MNISAISSINSAPLPEPAKATPQQSASTLPTDTVSFSSAAQKLQQAGDVDHDGDSH